MKLFIYSYGAFIDGEIANNRAHSHECYQISKVDVNSSIIIDNVEVFVKCGDTILLSNNVEHKLNDGHWINVLIDNGSELSRELNSLLGGNNYQLVNESKLIKSILATPELFLNLIDENIRSEVKEVLSFVSQHNHNCSLEEVSKQVGLSSERFRRVFKEELKISFVNYIKWQKIKKAFYILKENNPKKLIDVAYLSGFSDQAHMSKVIKETFGSNPKEIKNNL